MVCDPYPLGTSLADKDPFTDSLRYSFIAHCSFFCVATNLTPQYQKAEQEYHQARTLAEKIPALQKMLQEVPKHKASEKLQQQLKGRLAKLRDLQEKQRQQKKGGHSVLLKREGDAQIVLVGTTNSGKSTLLNALTGSHVDVADYPFTTTLPEVGIMDYHGVKLQIIEIPAIVEHFAETKMGPTFLSLIRQSDLMVLLFKTPMEKNLLDRELEGVETVRLIYHQQENFSDLLWERLGLMMVYTKQPGQKPKNKPLALKKGAMIRDVAGVVHKDFLKRFRYARVQGRSAKFDWQVAGLDHTLQDGDVVELHMK